MFNVWIGKRESDILTYPFFDYSITFYGSNKNNNISFCSKNRIRDSYSKEFVEFIIKNLDIIIKNNSETRIHFYNNTLAYKIINCNPEFQQYIVNLNIPSVTNTLRHKTLSRLWLSNHANTPAFCLLSKNECQIINLQNKFSDVYNSFIIQKNYSGGGTGTYLINTVNENQIINSLSETELYLVSPFYFPSLSLSCHIMIDNDKSIVFPVSEQILYTKNNNMEYVGNTYLHPSSVISKEVKETALTIGQELCSIGYRGICGFDFIFVDDKVLLIEINPRYQGSSYLLNFALRENNLPSLFELNSKCFNGLIPNNVAEKISNMQINYSNKYLKFQNKNDINIADSLLHTKGNILFTDGYENAETFENGCYLMKYIFPSDID